jgi:hypothetical protein
MMPDWASLLLSRIRLVPMPFGELPGSLKKKNSVSTVNCLATQTPGNHPCFSIYISQLKNNKPSRGRL